MLLESIMNVISESEYLVAIGLWVLGEIIKHTKAIDSRWIPFILLLASLIITPAILGGYTAYNINMAVIVTGLAVFGDQLLKQGEELVSENL